MSLLAKFEADFNALIEASRNAEKSLRDMEKGGKNAEDAINNVNKSGAKMGDWLGSVNKLLKVFGIGLSAAAVVNFAKSILDDADALTKLADKTGITVEGLQAMRIAGDDAGVSLEDMASAVTMLQKRLGGDDKSAVAALKDLGIEVGEFKRLDGARQMSDISDAVRGMHDPLRVAADLSALFGKSWAEQLPALKRGFQELKDGTGQMSSAAIKFLDDIGDHIKKTGRTWTAAVGEMTFTILDNSLTGGLLALNASLEAMQKKAEKAAVSFGEIIPPELPKDLEEITKKSDDFVKSFSEGLKEIAKIEEDTRGKREQGILGLNKLEQEASQKRFEAEVRGIDAVEKANADLTDRIAKDSLDSASYQITQIWRAADEKVKAFKGTTDQLAQFTTAVMDLAAREANAVVYESDRALTTVTEKAVGAARAVQLAIQQVEAGMAVDVVANRQAAGVTGVGMQAPIYVAPPIYARAAGGPVSSSQAYLVGERGPELFRPSTNGSITPNGWSGGATINNVFYVNGTAEDAARKIADLVMRSVLNGSKMSA